MKWKREDLKAWTKIPTRWKDHDIYGHVNNVVYYSYFDTAVIGNLIRSTGNDIRNLEAIGTVVESGCTFHKEIRFPQIIEADFWWKKLEPAALPIGLDFSSKRILSLQHQDILCMFMWIMKHAGPFVFLKLSVKP